jgi:hypothetical protein
MISSQVDLTNIQEPKSTSKVNAQQNIDPNIGAINLFTVWLREIMDLRSNTPKVKGFLPPITVPELPGLASPEAELVRFLIQEKLNVIEAAVLAFALVAETRNDLLQHYQQLDTIGPEISLLAGGLPEKRRVTMQTVAYTLFGDSICGANDVRACFDPGAILIRKNVLKTAPVPGSSHSLAYYFSIAPEYLRRFTTGEAYRPRFSFEFPARRIETQLEWTDLVLAPEPLQQVREIQLWLRHKDTFLRDWDMARKYSPGYATLFYGPPGTGKTMTATLLGKATDREVYRIDLSAVISKYIGETEKNLARIFDLAESRNWILFFDEADSLFGKRGRISDARDRYANQDVSFLLQRLEEFDGLSILASNLKSNIDEAFMRRFQSVIFFPFPPPPLRLRLWKQAIPPQAKLEEKVDLNRFAERYKLTGAAIMDIVRYASLLTIDRKENVLREKDILEGIRRSLLKEVKVI